MGQFTLGQALQQFLSKSRLEGNIRALQIEEVWEEIMGKTIARYTDSLKIINHTLFIGTSVAPLKNELVFQKEKIIQRVNEVLGENVIREVVIR